MSASNFLWKVAGTFATRASLTIIGLFTGVIVARTLGPEGRGLYAIAVTIGAIGTQFGNLGLHASNTYYVARDRHLLGLLTGNSLLVSLGLGGLGAFVTWLVFSIWPGLAPIDGLLLKLALLGIPFALAYLLLQNLLLGIQEVRAYNTVELVTKLVSILLLGIAIWLRVVSPTMVLFTSFVALIMGLIWVGWHLTRQVDMVVSTSLYLFRQGVRYGFKAYLAAFFAYLVLRIDLLMVKRMLGAEPAGYYSVAASMADMIYLLPVVVGSLLFPMLTTMTDHNERWRLTRRIAFLVGTGMLVVAAVALLGAKSLMSLLFGQDFLPSVSAFQWLMPAVILMSINTIFMNYFASVGMPLVTVYSPGIAVILNVLLNLWFLPRVGIIGAAWSSVAAYGLMLLFSWFYLHSKGYRFTESSE